LVYKLYELTDEEIKIVEDFEETTQKNEECIKYAEAMCYGRYERNGLS